MAQDTTRTTASSNDKTVGIPQDVASNSDSTTDNLLHVVIEDYNAARDYVKDNYLQDWQDSWKCYNNIRTRRGYEGISDDFIPETFTIIETLKANVAGGKPTFNFQPQREEQEQDTRILNNLMDFYWEQNRMTQKTLNWVQDMLVYGNAVLMVSWEENGPLITNIPLADFFVDPTATHMNNPEEPGYPKYAGYRFLASLDDLQKKTIVNPDTGEFEPMYTGLDDLPELGSEWDDLDKDAKEKFIGSTLGKDANKKQIECIMYFTKKKKIVVANRSKIIYQGANPYHRDAFKREDTIYLDDQPQKSSVDVPEIKPFLPFAILRNYVDGSLFYAKGDVENILPLQEALNDISSQKRDNITFVLNNMWQIDPQFQHLADTIESLPGAVYPIPKGALAPIEKQVVTGDADNEMGRLQEMMRSATAADEVIQGVSQNQGRITATEITAQQNNANQRFSTKLSTLESEGYAQLGRIMFKMVQIFVTETIAVRVVGQDGVRWLDFDPNQFTGEYEPKVELATTIKAQRAEEGQKYLQLHQILVNNPLINQKEFLQIYLDKVYDFSEMEVKRLMNVPPPDPNAASKPEPPKISVSLTGQLQPDVEAQLLTQAGIQVPQIDQHLASLNGQSPEPAPGGAKMPSPPIGSPLHATQIHAKDIHGGAQPTDMPVVAPGLAR